MVALSSPRSEKSSSQDAMEGGVKSVRVKVWGRESKRRQGRLAVPPLTPPMYREIRYEGIVK